MEENYSRVNVSLYTEDLERFERLADQMEAETGVRPTRSELLRILAAEAERRNLLAGVTVPGRNSRRRKAAA